MFFDEMKRVMSEFWIRRLEMLRERELTELRRKEMLNVNPNARLATVFGATFVM